MITGGPALPQPHCRNIVAPLGARGHFLEETIMADAGPGGGPKHISFGVVDIKPHAYDPWLQPEYFEGVPARRVIAFMIDLTIIAVPVFFAWIFIFLFGIATFGLGWALFHLIPPATAIWALVYCGATMGGPASATIGMRMVDLEIRTWYGARCYPLLGAVHALVFWVTISALTPLVLVVALLNERRRLLHDFVLGTVVINNEHRAALLRHAPTGGG
jgi:uncharacterized RDD family membrane protein YckC